VGESGEQQNGFFQLWYLGLQEDFGIVNWPYKESPDAHHEAPPANLLVFYMEYGTQ
jgi:hypothetical protein